MRNAICAIAAALLVGTLNAATLQELKDAFDRGDYPAVITEADRTMIADPLLSDSELYQMIMLKAEAMLRSGNRMNAAQEFAAAANVAPKLEQLAWARSSRLLLDRTNGPAYTPRTGENREPIDVVDTASRKRAFAALAADLKPSVARAYDAAMRATTLPALEDAILPVSDAAFLEIASTGQTSDMMPLLNQLGKHAQQLIAEDMTRMQRQISHLDRMASSYEDFSVGGRRGITSRERDELYDLQAYLGRVNERVQMYRTVALRIHGDTTNWDRLLLQIIGLQSDVDAMLSTRY